MKLLGDVYHEKRNPRIAKNFCNGERLQVQPNMEMDNVSLEKVRSSIAEDFHTLDEATGPGTGPVRLPNFMESPTHWVVPRVKDLIHSWVFPTLRFAGYWGPSRYDVVKQRAEEAVPLEFKCTCGSVEVEAGGGARHIFSCHCQMCARHAATRGGKAPVWTAVNRCQCHIKGRLEAYWSSKIGRRAVCARCLDAVFIDYMAPNTVYLANAKAINKGDSGGNDKYEADADIMWEFHQKGAKRTAAVVFDDMPLDEMGFIPDPGRSKF